MEKYKKAISAAVTLVEELAKLTETPWDDALAKAAHAVFEEFLGPHSHDPQVMKAGPLTAAVSDSVRAKAIPAWLLPLILTVIQTILDNMKK